MKFMKMCALVLSLCILLTTLPMAAITEDNTLDIQEEASTLGTNTADGNETLGFDDEEELQLSESDSAESGTPSDENSLDLSEMNGEAGTPSSEEGQDLRSLIDGTIDLMLEQDPGLNGEYYYAKIIGDSVPVYLSPSDTSPAYKLSAGSIVLIVGVDDIFAKIAFNIENGIITGCVSSSSLVALTMKENNAYLKEAATSKDVVLYENDSNWPLIKASISSVLSVSKNQFSANVTAASNKIFIYNQNSGDAVGGSKDGQQACRDLPLGDASDATMGTYGCGIYVMAHIYQWLTGDKRTTSNAVELLQQFINYNNTPSLVNSLDDTYGTFLEHTYGIRRKNKATWPTDEASWLSLTNQGGAAIIYIPKWGRPSGHYFCAVGAIPSSETGTGEMWIHIVDSSCGSTFRRLSTAKCSAISFTDHGIISSSTGDGFWRGDEYYISLSTFNAAGLEVIGAYLPKEGSTPTSFSTVYYENCNYKAIKTFNWRNAPSASAEIVGKANVGDVFTAVEVVKNSSNNMWVKTADGKYIYAGYKWVDGKWNQQDTQYLQFVSDNRSIEWENCNLPATLPKGQSFAVGGSLKSNTTMTSVMGEFYYGKSCWKTPTSTFAINGTSYSLYNSPLDHALKFGELPVSNDLTLVFTIKYKYNRGQNEGTKTIEKKFAISESGGGGTSGGDNTTPISETYRLKPTTTWGMNIRNAPSTGGIIGLLEYPGTFAATKKTNYQTGGYYWLYGTTSTGLTGWMAYNLEWIELIGNTDTTSPTISNVCITDISSIGYTVTCDVSDNVGVTSVKFPTWTQPNDQDDLIWHDGTLSGGRATFTVRVSDHNNENGCQYFTHIYAYDAAGNSSSADAFAPYVPSSDLPGMPEIAIQAGTDYLETVISWNATENTTHYDVYMMDGDGNYLYNPTHYRQQTADKRKFAALLNAGNYQVEVFSVNTNNGTFTGSGRIPFTVTSASAPSPIPHKYETEENHELYRVYQKSCTWLEAKQLAKLSKGMLVEINNSNEQAAVAQLVKKLGSRCWIGAERYHYGEWRWCSGSTLSYANWSSGEPNNYDGVETCAEMLTDGKWNDVHNCNSEIGGYVLEFPPQKLSISLKDSYYESDHTFTMSDLDVKVVFNDGTTLQTDKYTFTVSGGKDEDKTITVKYGDLSKKITAHTHIPVTGVSLNKTSISLNVGGSGTLTATVSPSNATNKNVSWSSSDPDVATVSNGTVTAKAAGKATITAKTADGGKTASCTVKVSVPVTGVRLSKTSLSLNVGGTAKLTATVSPSNATNKNVTWSSSDPDVASVSNGTVTAKAAGKATITVKTVKGGKTATCAVTVSVPVTGVKLSKTSLSLNVGGTAKLTATVSPSNATNKNVSWSSSDPDVASVSNGTVTAKAAGKATITVKTANGGKTASCAVTVSVPVAGVKLNKTSLSLNVGGTAKLTATVSPGNATNKNVTWSSSDPDVASVSNGTVTAKAAGKATITVKTANGGKTASCAVTVSVPVNSVTLDKTSLALNIGETAKLTATVSPSNATNKSVTWSSNDPNVVAVSDGTVTAIAAGKATIIVSTADGGKTATCAVTVSVPVTGVKLDKTSLSLNVGGTAKLTATVSPGNATNKNVSWSSSDPNVVAVSDGIVTAIAAGKATIRVSTADGGKTATCAVTVSVPVTGVTLDRKGTIKIYLGKKLKLNATVQPEKAKSKLKWRSSNIKIATVSANGLVTPIKAGTVKITVRTVTGNKKAIVTVKVIDPHVPTSVSIVQGRSISVKLSSKKLRLKANVKAIGKPKTKLTWKSSNTTIATVNKKGLVRFKKKGKVTISVTTSNGKKAKIKIRIK